MIGGATWILWLHLLAMAVWLGGGATMLLAILPGLGEDRDAPDRERLGVIRRTHFLASRAMEIVVVTGIFNLVARGMATGMTFSRPFFGMLSVKVLLLLVMAGIQLWLGIHWRRAEAGNALLPGKARLALAGQLALGALAILLGLGLRAV